ncbi:MAG: hypothetical protein MUC28_03635 [Planctomycetes bacterium]|jgi:predicted GH43/DUF377 family glycosyl hydrolase|nr:hypothetical protein [Planctomycetota bacterium]
MMEKIFIRAKNNPILRPDPHSPWQSGQVYNAGALFENKEYHLFYRAVGEAWVSKIGYAKSTDGENFICESKPLFGLETEIEKNGAEDPRVSRVGENYYLTYNAYDGDTARLCSAISGDLKTWARQGEMIPDWDAGKAKSFSVSWDSAHNKSTHRDKWVKSGAIFPQLINGRFYMLFGDRNIWLASSDDGRRWAPVWEPFVKPRPGFFDGIHVEAGPPPIKTDKGWIMLYHGINNNIVYHLGLILLDANDPTKIIHRSVKPVFEPEMSYELSGLVDILPGGKVAMETMAEEELKQYVEKAKNDNTMPSVIFCCGAVVVGDILRIYYGASDTVICTATAKLGDILEAK